MRGFRLYVGERTYLTAAGWAALAMAACAVFAGVCVGTKCLTDLHFAERFLAAARPWKAVGGWAAAGGLFALAAFRVAGPRLVARLPDETAARAPDAEPGGAPDRSRPPAAASGTGPPGGSPAVGPLRHPIWCPGAVGWSLLLTVWLLPPLLYPIAALGYIAALQRSIDEADRLADAPPSYDRGIASDRRARIGALLTHRPDPATSLRVGLASLPDAK